MKSIIPTFQTDRLILKQISLEDIPAYKKHFVNYAVISNLSAQVPWPYPDDGVEFFLNSIVFPNQGVNRWDWGLFLKTNPSEIIGSVGIWREGHPEHRGFWLSESFWGQGLMTEAVIPIMHYAFQDLGFEKLIFSNAVGNLKSRRIKEKTGATFIGVRPAKFVDPKITEAETFELTKESWLIHNAQPYKK